MLLFCIGIVSVAIRTCAFVRDNPDTDPITFLSTFAVLIHEHGMVCFCGMVVTSLYQDPDIGKLVASLLIPEPPAIATALLGPVAAAVLHVVRRGGSRSK